MNALMRGVASQNRKYYLYSNNEQAYLHGHAKELCMFN